MNQIKLERVGIEQLKKYSKVTNQGKQSYHIKEIACIREMH